MAGIVAVAVVLATVVAKAVGTKLVARVEAAVGEQGVQAMQVVLLSIALSVVCCGTVGGKALPMISARLTGTPTPKPTAVAFAVDMATKTSAPAAAELVADVLYREDPLWREDLRVCPEVEVDTVISQMVLSSPAPPDVLEAVRRGLATSGVTLTAENLGPAAMLKQVHSAESHFVRYGMWTDGPEYVEEVDLGLPAEWTVHRFRVAQYTIHDSGRRDWAGGWVFVLVHEEPPHPPLLAGFKVGALFFAEGQGP
jgi:hypothetical protein